jgi:DNA (cytosine-5)-methyltransferase 1
VTRRLTAIDLFSGCGGLSLGLKKAAFQVLAAVDNDPLANESYRKNHPHTLLLQQDITKVSATDLMRHLRLKRGQLDLLAGCPPCQGFSRLRTLNGQRRPREPMNDLVFQFLRFVRVMRPKAIMMENVPGLTKNARLKKFCRVLSKLGYDWQYAVLDAADYGVPQRRRRMILLASVYGPTAFARKSRSLPTVRTTIAKLDRPGRSGDPLHDHPARRSVDVQMLIKRIPRNGGGRTALPKHEQLSCHQKVDGFRDIYGRMAWDEPAPTITGGCINPSKGRFLHPRQDRAITLREAALLQGFPRRYFFSLKKGTYPAAQMIGNAFPPMFATRHARNLAAQLGTRRL